MTQHALYVQLEAKPGKEQEVANFLTGARSMVDQEPDTTAWFAIRMGPRPSRSSTPSPTSAAVRPISRAGSRRNSWPRPRISSP